MDKNIIRAIFLRNGFTIKEGHDDLKPYVYEAAEELIALALAGSAVTAGQQDLTACANCLRPKCEHNGKLCPAPYTTHWHAWDYADQQQPTYPEYSAPLPTKEGAGEVDAKDARDALRDDFAGQCCAAMVSTIRNEDDYRRMKILAYECGFETVSAFMASESYKQADALIAASRANQAEEK